MYSLDGNLRLTPVGARWPFPVWARSWTHSWRTAEGKLIFTLKAVFITDTYCRTRVKVNSTILISFCPAGIHPQSTNTASLRQKWLHTQASNFFSCLISQTHVVIASYKGDHWIIKIRSANRQSSYTIAHPTNKITSATEELRRQTSWKVFCSGGDVGRRCYNVPSNLRCHMKLLKF